MLIKQRNWKLALLAGVAVMMAACDSDETSSDAAAYIQFYNASPNSVATHLVLDEHAYTAVEFSDALPRYQYALGEAEASIRGYDAGGDTVELHEFSLDLKDGDNHLFVLIGDYESSEYLDIRYERSEMDEINDDADSDESKMQILAVHGAMDEGAYDLYLAKAGSSFSEAELLGSLSYKENTEAVMLDTGEYVLYLTEPGESQPVFHTSTMVLTSETVNKLVLHNSFGPGEPKLVVDNVDSTGTPVGYVNQDADAEFRVYNAMNQARSLDLQLSSDAQNINLTALTPNTLSDFSAIDYNDYGVSVFDTGSADLLANNLLVTFNQDESKTLVIYDNQAGETLGMTIAHDHRPNAFEHTLTVANLIDTYDSLDLYLVRDGETIDTAAYKLTYLSFTELAQINLPTGDYDISLVHKEDNGTLTLVYQSDAQAIDQTGNYTLVLSRDETQPLGHRAMLFQ
ncbi:hypothetical protein K0J45_09460 [Shewanella alkalitolerans]|uniref:hypothetical protein n=1 Tax=Shewanella alkalitolerans TaxID=2864209 RepID=UPI001C654D72|nr:hypothetical protein [Shewanella alkalitolerans]QYJ99394.1 hypothetical protein K0J45_09460 [Shewanella alkalitolerans]